MSNINKQIEVIVFDLYNTLIRIDTKSNYYRFLYKEMKKFENVMYEGFKQSILKNTHESILEQLPEHIHKIALENKSILEHELRQVKLFEETLEVLSDLSQEYQLVLVSNLASPYKEPFYDLGLAKYFSYVVFSCDVGFTKPHQAIFSIVEKNTGVSGNNIMMVGDSKKSDIEGAKSMGWQYLRVNRTISETHSAHEINSLLEIRSYL